MNKDILMDAIGMIDQEMVADAHRPAAKKRLPKTLRCAAAFAACFVVMAAVSLSAAAAGSDTAYRMLYSISPYAAQLVRPVNLSCTENGIRMEVISAEISGSDAYVYLSVEDMEGERVDGTIDLFDSYSINRHVDSAAHCEFAGYDEATGKASFLVHIQTMDGSEMKRGKVSFFLGYFLSGKNIISGAMPLDLAAAEASPATRTVAPELFRGDIFSGQVLAPVEGGIYTPGKGAQITALGYIDGRLHMQVRYESIWLTDNHGWFSLEDENGRTLDGLVYEFRGGERTSRNLPGYHAVGYADCYQEYIWDIAPEELPRCSLQANLWLCDSLTEGPWQVTFPLD